MQDHYEILGLPRNASQELIRATYKALLKIYHPDIFRGDKNFATEQLKKINRAHEILSDPKKKNHYDEEIRQNTRDSNSKANNFGEEGSKNERSTYQKIILEEWNRAVQYYPELNEKYQTLKIVNLQLAFSFQVLLVEEKRFEECENIYEKLLDQFFNDKFGTDNDIKAIAFMSIQNQKRDFARELNKAVKLLGENAKIRILKGLLTQFPDEASQMYEIKKTNFGIEKVTVYSKYKMGQANKKSHKNNTKYQKSNEEKNTNKYRSSSNDGKNYNKNNRKKVPITSPLGEGLMVIGRLFFWIIAFFLYMFLLSSVTVFFFGEDFQVLVGISGFILFFILAFKYVNRKKI